MDSNTRSSSFLNKLTKAVLIVVTAFCGSVNVTPPDRALDDTAQLNSSGSNIDAKSSARRSVAVLATGDLATAYGERGEPVDQLPTAPSLAAESMEFASDPGAFAMPRTSFGAGSFALSALGESASVPLQRS